MSTRNIKRVAVLAGGPSKEREVSLVSAGAAARALGALGYDVITIDVTRDVAALVRDITVGKPDVVFNALHGRVGEDGSIQGLLDMMALPYTHSGRMASAMAMDKPMAKKIFASVGIPVAKDRVVTRAEAEKGDVLPPPYVLKPTNEGSSVGIRFVHPGDNRQPLEDLGIPADGLILVEQYIPGREVTVAVMGEKALAVTEIMTDRSFYDYEAKYASGGSTHVIPAALDKKLYDRAMELSLTAHRALGCRGVSRADLRFDGTEFYMLEVNTQPGLTPTSLVPEQALHLGISFNQLIQWMVEHAACDA
ncbi:MAG: D-alanine--D-alanine ligase [Alphaproteobacteria bacterium]|nr:D-alanine--D-alanine ligase [Alphaproteobacteria bacterium]PHX99673.1 MAG: D-alanine--D-alanine ligase [Rhodospirillaceae bacterium]